MEQRKFIQVTTWAKNPDFDEGRWVQLGKPTLLNFWLTGLPGGKIYASHKFPYFVYRPCDVEFDDHSTAMFPATAICKPTNGITDGWVKALFGQRRICK